MSQGGSSLIANWVTVGLLLIVTHQVRRPVAEQAVEPQQWLEAETTQMIPVGAPSGRSVSSESPRPGASPASATVGVDSANTAPITPISPDEGGDEPTEVVDLPGGRP
jgi:cytoskeletal protein RodZ